MPLDEIMAAMICAVDDGVGEILAELKRNNLFEDTIVFFQSDNGPSRESRNWMDGSRDPYYGGSAGIFKGHKYSLFEGGIRVPGIISYPAKIPQGQVLSAPCAAMDLFPTLCSFAGISCAGYELDGLDISGILTDDAPSPHDMVFWEMDGQAAVRQGNYANTCV